ncbi:MAG: MlaD family protein [Sphingobacteriales bacterium]|nr:MlaD family protein [Sphingobacteriales bacterium]
MKISNETKVGTITALAITLLILGFNFLKGKTLFATSHTLFAKYTNVQGLANSNPVMINGLQVGTVYSITTDKNMKVILVNMNITKDVNIPLNSVAYIKPNPLGTTNIEIKLGDADKYIAKNDTIQTEASAGIFTEAMRRIDPIIDQVVNTIKSIDTVMQNISHVIDPNAKNNIQATLANLNKLSANLITSSASLQTLLNTETGSLSKSLNNVTAFTDNLVKNNDKITQMISNLDKTSGNLSKLDLEKTLTILNATINDLKSSIGKLNSTNGTAGLLLNDTKLYNNLTATANKVNLLIDDLKTNPKRYISFSVFGKKYKGTELTTPLPDTINAPYLKQK